MEVVDFLLRSVGLLSIVLTIIRTVWVFCTNNIEYWDDLTLTVYDNIEELDDTEKNVSPQFEWVGSHEYAQFNLFKPNNMKIKKIQLLKVQFDDLRGKSKMSYKLVKSFENVTPLNPLCIVIERPEIVPEYVLKWQSEYGAEGMYFFGRNGRTGQYNRNGFEYRMSTVAKIRKILGLK